MTIRLPRIRILAKRVRRIVAPAVPSLLDHGFQTGPFLPVPEIELPQERKAFQVAVGNEVEFLLDAPGEVQLDQRPEMFLQEQRDDEGRKRRDKRLPLPPHVPSIQYGLDDRRVGGRTPDAVVLQPLDERRVGVPGRGGRLVRFRREVQQRQRRIVARQGDTVSLLACRKQCLPVPQVGRGIVAPLHVGAEVSRESG